MGKSFFLGTEAELATGSNTFSTQINSTPLAFGLSVLLASQYETLNTTWQEAYVAAKDPLTRTKAKVQAKNDAKAALKILASDLAKIIEGTPTVTNEQKVALGLSVRAAPSPIGPPGTPGNFKASLNGNGDLILTWKCQNPTGAQGTIYQVWRQIGNGPMDYVGGSGEKSFVDSTLPAGTASVTYQIQGVRSTTAGEWAQFNVNFGSGSNGQTMTVTETQPVKIVA